MQWDLALPLLIMAATVIVMGGIMYAARGLLFKPRDATHTDATDESGADQA